MTGILVGIVAVVITLGLLVLTGRRRKKISEDMSSEIIWSGENRMSGDSEWITDYFEPGKYLIKLKSDGKAKILIDEKGKLDSINKEFEGSTDITTKELKKSFRIIILFKPYIRNIPKDDKSPERVENINCKIELHKFTPGKFY